MSKAKSLSKKNGAKFLKDAFSTEQEVLRKKLLHAASSVTHDGELGGVSEGHFIEFLQNYLPKRYAVDSAIVIDSNGRTSDQIDIVIFDNQYTPLLLPQQRHRYVPAEAVYAVLEVKQKIDKGNLQYAGTKAESVRKLQRTSVRITAAGTTEGHEPKKPFPILSGILATDVAWSDGFESNAFIRHHNGLSKRQGVNFGLALSGHYFDDYESEKHRVIGKNALAQFLFRLLGALQDLGTVTAADWSKYAKVFNKDGS